MAIAVQQRPRFFYRPSGIILIILLAAVSWMLFPGNLQTLALVAVGVIFVYGFKRPFWAMAAFMVSQLTVTSYMVYTPVVTVSLRLFLLMLIGIIIWRSRAYEEIDLGPRARKILVPLVVLIAVAMVSDIIFTGFDNTFKDFRNFLVGVLIVAFLPAAIRNIKEFKMLCAVVFIGITASSIVGIMQHYQIIGAGTSTLIPGFLGQWGEQTRVPGMAETELELSYIICVSLVGVFGIIITKGIISGNRALVWLSVILMGMALYFTYTRSAIVAVVFGLVALVIFLKTRIKGEIVLFVSLAAIILIASSGIMEANFLGGRAAGQQEQSTLSRKILWQAGLSIALDNPILGIGASRFQEVSPEYESSVDPELIAYESSVYFSYRTLGNEDPHNDFINIWTSYGTFALIIYIWIIVAILRNFLFAYHVSRNRFLIGVSVGLAAGMVAYLINSFYHNCLHSMPFFWILAGFSLAAAKLAVKKKPVAQIPPPPTGDGS